MNDCSESTRVEVSIVIPCLNEAETLATCIDKARGALNEHKLEGEIIVADNGSTDGSNEIAKKLGARVVHVKERGYGNALIHGISAARGEYIVMGDADDSYDFREIPNFIRKLREGFDLVQGCRLPTGGGTILSGAMPFLHRFWGNPMFSYLTRRWFKSPIHDLNCGMRGFRKDFYDGLDQRCTGMEFAAEMIIKASLRSKRIGEIPITLYPDGRKSHAPHLRTFRDGWRTIRLLLIYSPRWLFLVPGLLLILFGLVGYVIAFPGLTLGGVTFDVHTLLFASLAILCGHQSIIFAVSAKMFAISEGLLPEDRRMTRFFELVYLERGLIISSLVLLCGAGLLMTAVLKWKATGFGRLDYVHMMRLVIPGATLTALAIQNIFSSFFLSLLGMRRR
jgi:glycosyltransferase involved in cell wall biosynthesis